MRNPLFGCTSMERDVVIICNYLKTEWNFCPDDKIRKATPKAQSVESRTAQ